jgi:hypothetical protein
MPSQLSSIDFVAYDKEGQVLLAEAKSRRGTLESWAAGLRRNMLSHGILPSSKYFLIATPERMYLWKQQGTHAADSPPEFTIDAEKVFLPYFQRLHQEPVNIGPEAFELLVLTWLTDITRSGRNDLNQGPFSAGLSELTGSLRQARVEMHPIQ